MKNKFIFILYIAVTLYSCNSIKNLPLDNNKTVSYNYEVNDSIFQANVDNIRWFYIIDTIIIHKPYIIATPVEELITDSITAQSIDIEDLYSIRNNPKIYRLRHALHFRLPLKMHKNYPFKDDQGKEFSEITSEKTKEVYDDNGKIVSISYSLRVDSIRFFVGMVNYFFERDIHFHTVDGCRHIKGFCPFELDPGFSLDLYVKVVSPIDYLEVLTLWSRLMNHKELIDVFIKKGFGFEKYTNDSEDNPIGRRNFLIKYDHNLLKYSAIPAAYYDSLMSTTTGLKDF